MIEVSQNLWEVEADIICVTTNGTVYSEPITHIRKNVMGGGCALEARKYFPKVEEQLGEMIDGHGNHVYLLRPFCHQRSRPGLVSFPTKENVNDPSTIERVAKSLNQLWALVIQYEWSKVALPRPGCGLGGLDWETEVKPLVEPFNDWLIIVDFPGKK